MTTAPAKTGPPKDEDELSHRSDSPASDQEVVAVRAPDPLPIPAYDAGHDLSAIDFDIPEYKALSRGEIGGLMQEGLEAYRYGERTRFDTGGKRWTFRREAVRDQFRLLVTVSIGGYLLGEGGIGLDRLAGVEGEDALMALVDFLAQDTVKVAQQAREDQKKLRSEAEKAREDQAKADAKAAREAEKADEKAEREAEKAEKHDARENAHQERR
jgi:hypothetical protein